MPNPSLFADALLSGSSRESRGQDHWCHNVQTFGQILHANVLDGRAQANDSEGSEAITCWQWS